MEVHHHAHTRRKKFRHYFWEFLMLFLAVFCGFLAEYWLEHIIEHQREKKYAALASNPEIFDWNKGTAIKLYNMMALLRDQNKSLNQYYNDAYGKAILVMQQLKKEYHIK